ncbi:NAD(P)H-dependent amine dehydrogenase family protein [Nocardia bovistercoris]|uniref:Dihydrodipicolinate reductase n=1 Tax=Nocardia bovistercoris TaxID=2785916 RepID=A0A931N485_9NOCA|nr:dihydrodipicolinate reductase [Nocardia bovistercoris]MBH0778462.1 dihydrodipicolinate reductase [Nocardia bovistercoris]
MPQLATDTPLRIVQWTTGNVARAALPAILGRPDLELVGCYAWSQDKVGQDAALLCGLGEPCGVAATDDVDTLLALKPDCVVYTPLYPDIDLLERVLRAGVNVVTTAEFLTGHSKPGFPERLRAAAAEGGASIFGSGMNPGYAQLLSIVATGVCTRVRHIRSVESVDVSAFASDSNMNGLGWGRPMGDPGHVDDVRAAVAVFADGVHVVAASLGIELDSVDCRVDFGAATKDLPLEGRPIAKGTVAGLDVRFIGILDGREVIELHQRWVMDSEIDPPMPADHGYRIEIDGTPQVSLTLGLLPDQPLETLTVADLHGIGMTITAMPAVNAIRHVVAAAPGILTYADIPAPAAALVR